MPFVSSEISSEHDLQLESAHNRMPPHRPQHKQHARTNQTWTRTRALNLGSRQCSISPSITAHASAAQQDLTHQICDLMTSPPQQHHSLPPPSCPRTRQTAALEKTSAGTEPPHRPRPRAERPRGPGSTGRWGLRAPGRTPRKRKWGEADTGRRNPNPPLRSAGKAGTQLCADVQ
ncbi:hypothetical protein SETIT_9G262700v2 [Setaria italica]|uniref:Uncharacterized protein n=2 Tax=Setaria TaxID=4554 RepID=A0A368SKR2_SETIT|nr:hypothetical protein SETIT_9G262700v2 [Setaria italica]TKV93982.1 hypothetical protein SEVIR_9G265700v2 [Setaria viridis]